MGSFSAKVGESGSRQAGEPRPQLLTCDSPTCKSLRAHAQVSAVGRNLVIPSQLIGDAIEICEALIHRRLRRQRSGDRLVGVELKGLLVTGRAGQARIEDGVRVV